MLKTIVRNSLRVSKYHLNSPFYWYNNSLIERKDPSSHLLTHTQLFTFVKISKKEKEKQKNEEEKKKAKEQLGGNTSTFDLNPYEEKYQDIIQSYKSTIASYKTGRIDPSFFSNIRVKIGTNALPIQQLAEVAPKSANSCVLNPFDNDYLDAIQKGIESSDMGFQVSRVDKTILVTQPSNSQKDLKQKLMQKLKKSTEIHKQKISKVRSESKENLKPYKKLIPDERLKAIQKELQSMHEKFSSQFQKIFKDKEKDLTK